MERRRKALVVLSSFMEKGQLNLSTEKCVQKMDKYKIDPVFVDGNISKKKLEEAYNRTTGVILTGGDDVNPRRYGQTPHSTTIPDDIRDDAEFWIVEKAREEDKPLLGICRGMQVMAVAAGGSLIQHIPDEYPEEQHGVSIGMTDPVYPSSIFHDIVIKPGTKAFEIFSTDRISVPSRHHQAVRTSGDLLISGKSPGGIAEMIEHPTLLFHFGTQTHPEFVEDMDAVFKKFVKANRVYEKQIKNLAA